MTPEQRLDRVETALSGLVEVQGRHADNLGDLIQTVSKFVDSSDARMKRIEDNLDGLIRAMMAEHSNGKSSH